MVHKSLAFLLSFLLLLSPVAPLAGRAAAATTPPPDGGWPRAYTTTSGVRFTLYQPQVASWTDQKRIVMYAAVSMSAQAQKPALGTIRIEADTKVALDERLVNFSDLEITASNFPTLSRDALAAAIADLKAVIPREDR